MKTLLTLTTLCLLTGFLGATPPNEKAAVTEAFASYRHALTTQDGEKAAQLISKDAQQIYEYYRQAALSGTREEILQVPLVHQAAILVLRGKIPAQELLNMTGAQVYAHTITQGLIAHKWTEAMDVLNVEFPDSHTAILTIGVKDKPGTKMLAVQEGKEWKFSLREILLQSNEAIQGILTQKGINPEQYLKNVIEAQLGPNSYATIWTPPAQRVRKATPEDDVIWAEMPR